MTFISPLLLFFSTLGLSLALSCTGDARGQAAVSIVIPPPVKTAPSPWQKFADGYASFFNAAMSQTNTPGASVVIVKDSQIILLRGFGLKAGDHSDSVDAHTVFRLGSLSKGFAGVLAGMLVEDSVLTWDEPVRKRYPEFRLVDARQADRVQLRHVLSHTTGLPYHAFTNLIEEDYPLDRIASEYFPKSRLFGREGEFYAYSNAAFSVAGEVMHRATGMPYPELLREKIFRPAGMLDASCDYLSMSVSTNHALPNVWTGYGWRAQDISPSYYSNAAPAGGVNASAADMGQWLLLLLGHRPDLVSPATLDQVFMPLIKTDKERRIFPNWIARDAASYAMGWRVLTRPEGDQIIYHSGYVNGYRCEIALSRTEDLGICVLFNANTDLARQCVPVFFEQWNRFKSDAAR